MWVKHNLQCYAHTGFADIKDLINSVGIIEPCIKVPENLWAQTMCSKVEDPTRRLSCDSKT